MTALHTENEIIRLADIEHKAVSYTHLDVYKRQVEELLGVPATESSTEIDVDMIHVFKNHPFKVLDDEKMSDLVESIRVNGILSPVLVRPDGEDSYEMISGHRRMHAAKIVGLTMIPAIVREIDVYKRQV